MVTRANLQSSKEIRRHRHLVPKTRSLFSRIRQVKKQLGHASPATTAKMYADNSFEDMQNGLNGFYQ
jgi:integrase